MSARFSPTSSRWSDDALIPRLSLARLRDVPREVRVPRFDPRSAAAGILHLGCGSFHRAHQALLTQQAIEAELDCAAHHRRCPPGLGHRRHQPDQSANHQRPCAAGRPLYRLERGPSGTRASVVGTLRGLVYAPESRSASAGLCGSRDTDRDGDRHRRRLLHRPATGRLDAGLIDVQKTFAAPIRERRSGARGRSETAISARHATPVVLSCDNLPSNGSVLRRMCIDFAALQDDRLAHWIESHVQFPATMVDRIVPLATAQDREDATAAWG
jgi:fructuronate reductase